MEPNVIDPVALVVTLGAFGVLVKGAVDALRRQWPRIDGLASQVLSVGLGTLVAFGFDLQAAGIILEAIGATAARVPTPAVDYLVTGAVIGLGAGFLAEISGRSGRGSVVIEVDEVGDPVV